MQSNTSSKPQSAVIEVRDNFAHLPAFVREKQLRKDFIQIAHGTLWGWVADKRFPAPEKLSSGVTAWKRSDLMAWAAGAWEVSNHGV